MKVSILQSNIMTGGALENLSHLDVLMRDAEPGSLLVLPELFATGFVSDPVDIAAQSSEVLSWMRDTALRLQCAVVGSLAVKDGTHYFNRMVFIDSHGEDIARYDKRHLFGYGGETLHFTRGHRRVVVSYGGMRFLLQVCYDLRFPVFSRCQHDYDAIINVANWPTGRQEAWSTLLRARAIENQCFVIGVNRVGVEGRVAYSGGSAVIDYLGHTLCSSESGSEQLLSAELRTQAQQAYRREFPVLDDADSFSLHLEA